MSATAQMATNPTAFGCGQGASPKRKEPTRGEMAFENWQRNTRDQTKGMMGRRSWSELSPDQRKAWNALFPEKKPTFVSICKNQILANLKNGTNIPVIRLSKGMSGRPWRQHAPIEFKNINLKICSALGKDDKPASWGARVWLEITDAESKPL